MKSLLAVLLFGIALSLDAEALMKKAMKQAEKLADYIKRDDRFPYHTPMGESGYVHYLLADLWMWTSGFYAGSLWDMYEYSGDEKFKELAIKYTEKLEPNAVSCSNHDVGFLIYYSFGKGHLMTGDERYKDVTIKGAQLLAKRYVPKVGAIRSWGDLKQETVQVIVDTIMNLEILFFAYEKTGNITYKNIAIAHLDSNMRDMVRKDFTHYHEVDYSATTGKVTGYLNPQGKAPETTWARGQAWAIHGFAQAYRYTLDRKYLDLALKMAKWFMDHLPEDYVALWDFDGLSSDPRDSSASAIAASGMFELYHLTGNVYMKKSAFKIMESLSSDEYLANPATHDNILLHTTYAYTGNIYDTGISFGDSYYVEALKRIIMWNIKE